MQTQLHDIKLRTFDSPEQWQNELDSYQASIFLYPDWIESLKTDFITPVYFDFIQNQSTIGKLSGVIARKKNYRILNCYAGIALLSSENQLSDLYPALYNYAKKNSINRIIIGSYDQQVNHDIQLHKYYTTQRKEYIIQLKKYYCQKVLSTQLKRNLKKASKTTGSVIHKGNKVGKELLFKMLNHTQQKRKSSHRNTFNPLYISATTKDSTNKLLHSTLSDCVVFEHNKIPHCIEFNLKKGTHVYNYLRGADVFAYLHSLPSLTLVKMLEYYQSKGVETINLGGIPGNTDGDFLARFKLGIGASEVIQYGLTTNFIQYPFKLLNPFLNIGRKLKNVPFIYRLKDLII